LLSVPTILGLVGTIILEKLIAQLLPVSALQFTR
jgi:hypothetical protein